MRAVVMRRVDKPVSGRRQWADTQREGHFSLLPEADAISLSHGHLPCVSLSFSPFSA
jgi:hypothetical protein